MNLSIEQFERIESYLKGQMSEQERFIFEEEERQSVELQNEIKIHKDLHFGLENSGVMQNIIAAQKRYNLNVEDTDEETGGVVKPIFKFSFTQLALAASFVLLIGFGVYRNQYYISSDAMTFANDEIALKSSPFQLPSNISKSDKDILTKQRAEWFFALAFVKQKEKKKAKVILQRITQTENHPFKEQAKKLLEKL
jgi:hypothetical protein